MAYLFQAKHCKANVKTAKWIETNVLTENKTFTFLNSQTIIAWESETTQEPLEMQCNTLAMNSTVQNFQPWTETMMYGLKIVQQSMVTQVGGSQNAWREIWMESTLLQIQ